MNNNITILLNTCDHYEDLWLPFFTLLNKYWKNHPKVIVSTETKQVSFKNVETINYNSKIWGERILYTLSKIDTEFIVLMLDDFFLREAVKEKEFNETLDFLIKNKDISAFYFLDTGSKFRNQFMDDKRFEYYELAKENASYKLNLQSALWRRKDLINYINKNDSPWTFEVIGTKYLKTNKKFYFLKPEIKIFNYGYNPNGMGVFRGKWVKQDVVKLFEKENIKVDYNKRGFYKTNIFSLLKNKIKLKLNLLFFEYKHYK